MSREFTHLHVHTEYSLLDGFSPIKKLLDYAKEIDMESLAITDHGSMFGIVQFYKEAKKRNIKPIIGCEIYTVNGSYLEKNNNNKRYNHLILLAENYIGYKNLMEIVSLGYVEGFYYKPRVDKDILRKYSEGIIALSACLKGEVSENLIHDDYDKAKEVALQLEDIFGKGNFFLELQNHGIDQDKIILEQMPKLSKETGIPMVATNDIHYVRKEDWKIHDILLCVQLGKTIQEKNEGGMHYAPGEFYLRTAEEMYELFEGYEEALENTNRIAKRCNVELDFGTLHLPYFEIPEGYTNKEYLRELSIKGINNRYKEVSEEILDRLEFELKTIEDMGFVDYFLIVSDFIRFSKSKNIPVGPGRGSAAGSIVSYALGITDINPLKYDLLFERFLNPERVSMPDIDIDFCYERREEVIDYVIEKYGKDRVAQIVTFGTMAARGAIRDVGRVLDMDYNVVDDVAKKVPMLLNMTIDKALEMSPEFKLLYDSDGKIKNLIDIANALEGIPRHTSTHAAGVVISEKPVVEYVPLARNKDAVITQFNMIELEELGLLKMDFLGLRTLTVIQDAVDLVNKNHKEKISIDDMDENDSDVLSIFTVAETLGIFQFESAGMRAFLRELKPTKFDDLIAANSLFRPGPMNEIPTYIYNKNHPSEIKYLHPLLEPILNVTYGTIVYQEQVMQIVQQLAGYSLGAADNLRRAMGKKKMDVMEAERKKFIDGELDKDGTVLTKGAIRNGVPRDVANKIYDLMIDFAKYAFNKSHSAAYSLVAMRTAWLKYYYPVEFMAALLSSVMGNTSQVALYIQESKRLEIEILQPDINYSFKKFDVQNNKIRFGLMAIKNVGEALINTIVESREEDGEFKSFREFIERIVKKNSTSINKRAIECLIKAGAFSSLGGTKAGLMVEYSSVIDSIQSSQKKNIPGQASLFDLFEEDSGEKQNSEISYKKEYDKKELLKQEKEVLGIYLSDHPMRPYEDLIDKYSDFNTLDLKGDASIVEANWDKKNITIIGIVESVNKKFTKNNKIMEFVKIEDLFGTIELVVFPNMYDKYSNLLEEDNVLMIKGTLNISERDGANIIVSNIKSVDDLVSNDTDVKINKLFIRIPENSDDNVVDKIKLILEKANGKDIVNIYFEESKKAYKLPRKYCIDVNNKDVLESIKNHVGFENIKII
ncbi:DNA polymerase III subunit alpha [Peptostreptococcaceae bacterium OttesenSCG-928-C18]|nr:DNA polymerase III subunit alpha [Peptostreptococcaceae bacterium OttesenSCG-928-C18]